MNNWTKYVTIVSEPNFKYLYKGIDIGLDQYVIKDLMIWADYEDIEQVYLLVIQSIRNNKINSIL